MAGTVLIALLRGVNVGGNKKVGMAELREAALGIGCRRADSYINSGNLVLVCDLTPRAAEAALEEAIEERFGIDVSVIVRTAAQWHEYAAGSAFPDAEEDRPSFLHLALSKKKASPGAVASLLEKAKGGERIALVGDALWIDFRSGVGKSKVTPAVLDRLVGSPVTARNWRTVQKLAEMARAAK